MVDAKLPLRSLDLSHVRLTPAGLASLTALKSLESLAALGINISAVVVQQLRSAIPSLTELKLNNNNM